MPSPLPLPSRNASVSDLLENASRLFRATLPKTLPLAMAAMLLQQLSAIYWLATGHTLGKTLPQDPTFWVLYGLGLCGNLLLVAALVLRLHALRAGRVSVMADELRAALRRWPTLLAAWLGAALIVMLGTLLLVVPGVYLAVCMAPLLPVVMLEATDFVTAIRRSIALVRPLWLKVFAALVIVLLVVIVCIIAAAAIIGVLALVAGAHDSAASTALQSAGMLLVQAIALVFFAGLSLTIYSAASSSA